MKLELRSIAANQTEITLASGVAIFFSYQTPVAAFIPGRGTIKTDQHFSGTTSRHINKWVDGRDVETVPQSVIEALV